MKLYQSFAEGVTKFTNVLLVVIMGVMSVLVFGQVITRYIIGSTPAYVLELSTYCLIWVSFLGSSIAIRWNKHVALTILIARLSPEKAKSMVRLINIFVLVFLAILLVATTQYAIGQWGQYSSTMGIRITWPALGASLGTLLMIIQVIQHLLSPSDVKIEEGGI